MYRHLHRKNLTRLQRGISYKNYCVYCMLQLMIVLKNNEIEDYWDSTEKTKNNKIIWCFWVLGLAPRHHKRIKLRPCNIQNIMLSCNSYINNLLLISTFCNLAALKSICNRINSFKISCANKTAFQRRKHIRPLKWNKN